MLTTRKVAVVASKDDKLETILRGRGAGTFNAQRKLNNAFGLLWHLYFGT